MRIERRTQGNGKVQRFSKTDSKMAQWLLSVRSMTLFSCRFDLSGHTGRFIKAVVCTSLLFLLAHICFQIVLYTYPPLNLAIGDNCSQWDTITRHIGLSRLPLDDPWNVLRLLCPDVGVFLVSLVTTILCSKLVRSREMIAAANITSVTTRAKQLAEHLKATARKVLCDLGRILTVVLLGLAGITLPSAFSAVYFLLFIGVCTWWACHLPISHLGFNALCVMVGFFTAGHMMCLYLYQSLFAQDLFPPHHLWARLFGLKDIIVPGNCSISDDLILNPNHTWPVYVHPGILLFLYLTVTAVLKSGYHVTPVLVCNSFISHWSVLECVQGFPQRFISLAARQALLGIEEAHSGQLNETPLFLLSRVVMQQSYVCALIAMMVWSITYHSWLTFVLLLWACLIWILRSRRHAATLSSPFILLYGLALCCLQYIWAMELQPELPTTVGTMSLRQLGLDKTQYPCLRLGAMVRSELCLSIQQSHCYAKYWIYVCGGMFIMVSFAGKLVAYKIVYMLLFLLCLCLYQVYYSLWRHLLKLFWWLVVAYTMLVLITIYTYQFEDFPGYWKNLTGFTDEQLGAVGLETFALSELFTSIVIPGFFLLACILQLHYFHKPFMRITDLDRVTPKHRWYQERGTSQAAMRSRRQGQEEKGPGYATREPKLMPSKWGLVMDRLLVLSRKFSDTLIKVQVFLWRILELHILKMVAFVTVWVALEEPSVMNLVLVVLWSLAMPFCRFRPMACCLSTVWVCVIIVCKMLYQLSVVNPDEYSHNCSMPLTNKTSLLPEEVKNSTLYKEPVDPAKWFGIRKDDTALGYSKNHLIVLLLLVFEATVNRHQAHHYLQLQRSPPIVPALFPAATRDTLDEGLVSCLKYLLNYTFYKFGLEICFLMTLNVIGQRMNFLVIIHGCWLVAILVRRRRTAIAKIWPKYCLFLSIFMIYQYLLCVGIPPALCIEYPWRWNTPLLMNSALIKWIYLPDFYTVPNSKNLIADFMLLMCASQQWKVFEYEKVEEWMVLAGENSDEPEPMEGRLFNPAPNFINCRSYLDMAKVLVFRYFFWFVLSVVFITGATRISVFGLGYLLASFFFLLYGTKLLIKPSRTRLILWDCLIIYNLAVIISKNVLSILACVFVFEMQKGFCWVIQLFSLVCTVKGYYDPNSVSDDTCSLPVEEAGIIWDSLCFLCLLLQRRVFLSFYFLHVTEELQAFTKQASRGFELFRASIMKNIKCHQQTERKSLTLLKKSMQRIRSKQQKYKEGQKSGGHSLTIQDPGKGSTHRPTSSRKKNWSQPWSDHATVIHSGEYYLFESDSEDEEDLVPEEKKLKDQSACQLAYQAWVSNVKTALRERQRRTHPYIQVGNLLHSLLLHPVLCPPVHGEMVQKILDILQFLWVIVLAMVDGLTQWLNLLTKQYSDASSVLCEERYSILHKIKQVSHTSTSIERGSDLKLNTKGGSPNVKPQNNNTVLQPEVARCHRYSRTASEILSDRQFCIEELEQSREFFRNQNRLLKLLLSMYTLLSAHSELLCYFIIVLNNVVSASVISLILPMLVFLWAMLSVPRPTKRFWMTAIVYTEVMVVLKYIFQFGFFPWNSVYETTLNKEKPFFPPRIFGLEKADNYLKYDLLQLLALFFHRSLLMVGVELFFSKNLLCKQGSVDHFEPRTSSTALSNEPFEPDPATTGSQDQQQILSGETTGDFVTEEQRDRAPLIKGGSETHSSIRIRKKTKETKDQHTKGLYRKLPSLIKLYFAICCFVSSFGSIKSLAQGFFSNITQAEYQASTDVYALMFLTDVIDFVIIIFGFWAFGKHSAAADIASTLSEDQVPEAFLVMLLIQFSTMIIDRALYLRKAVLGKLIFQFTGLISVDILTNFIIVSLFFRMFNQNFVAQLWYFVKCIYFGLSAYQIRCGYPTRILGNFLTKKYNHLNLFLFQGFRLVPFLVELRAVMDWVWTDTTLSLSDWMCVEDIYANIFIIKCSRETEKNYPQPKGQKKKKIVKYGMGGLIIFFLICIIWFPLLFISLVRSVVGVVNHPIDVTVTVKLGGYEPLFTMSVQQQSIKPFTDAEFDQLTKTFGDNVAMQFITLYNCEDIVTAMIEGSSGSVWRISPPSRQELIKELLESPADLTLRLAWNFQRDLGKGGTVEHTFGKHSINLEPGNPVRANLASLLVGNLTELVPGIFPNYIRAPNGAEAKPVSQLYKGQSALGVGIYNYQYQCSSCSSGSQEWWNIAIAGCDPSACDVLPMVIFNDKVSPPSLGFLAGYGIMGLYVSVVLVIGKFVRGFFSEISHSIMFEELPCVDRILKLCMDIFLVRETGELELEEELYSKLIFLYRSPETMIKWTRDIQTREHD
uniref:Piezo type mechanosensitive ion channel component 1 (Er blood group) n=1 Tax=Nothobranchius furzeri TaxID=105023 RepID=A0A8C6L0J5_NOTFU